MSTNCKVQYPLVCLFLSPEVWMHSCYSLIEMSTAPSAFKFLQLLHPMMKSYTCGHHLSTLAMKSATKKFVSSFLNTISPQIQRYNRNISQFKQNRHPVASKHITTTLSNKFETSDKTTLTKHVQTSN